MRRLGNACACAALLLSTSAAFADTKQPPAQPYHRQVLPQLYITAEKAQEACPKDQVVWVNWSAGHYHLPDEKFYGTTDVGAYACRKAADAVGLKHGS